MKYLVLIFIGFLFSIVFYQSYQYDNIFQIIIYPIFGITWLLIFYKCFVNEIVIYKKTRRKSTFRSIFIAIITLVLNLCVYIHYESKINSPTLLKARIFGGYADFKKNGEYIIVSGAWASRTHFYGNYKIKDSLIFTDRSKFDDIITTDKFLIWKSDTIEDFDNLKINTFLIQVDDNGKEIFREDHTHNFRLRVVQDNRN